MYTIPRLLIPKSPLEITYRALGKNAYNWPDEGIQYPGFKYYPRHSDSADPPYEPAKLFRVQRIKPTKGVPYWQVNILKQFKLDGRASDVAILKNIPEINSRLWRIKHLIKITPITFPNGMPEDENGTYLKESGEVVVIGKVFDSVERNAASEEFEKDSKKLNGDTIRRELRKRWLNAWNVTF